MVILKLPRCFDTRARTEILVQDDKTSQDSDGEKNFGQNYTYGRDSFEREVTSFYKA